MELIARKVFDRMGNIQGDEWEGSQARAKDVVLELTVGRDSVFSGQAIFSRSIKLPLVPLTLQSYLPTPG